MVRSPELGLLHVQLGVTGLIVSYAVLVAAALGAPRLVRRRRRIATLRRRRKPPADGTNSSSMRWISSRRPRVRRRFGVVAGLGFVVVGLAWAGAGAGAGAAGPVTGLRVSVLDVGQGDAILLQPAGAPAVLVDGGPPGDGLAGKLRAAGVERLGAAVVTHEQSDHAGGIEELLGRFPVGRLAYARLESAPAWRGPGPPARIPCGSPREAILRSGRLRIEVLWPPRELLGAPLAGDDPNNQALVLLARWRDFSILLTADAEAEAVPIDPGPVDVLKVAHHGSDDAGLAVLLDRIAPRLAVISVGEGNPYGHPTATTLATLAAHHVPTLRTDTEGTIVLDVSRAGVEVSTSG